MGYGKSKESAAQERKNLLGINAVDNRATSFGGSWMSKHSIAKSGSKSPLHHDNDGKKHNHSNQTTRQKISKNITFKDSYGGRTQNYNLLDAPGDLYRAGKKLVKKIKNLGDPDSYLK